MDSVFEAWEVEIFGDDFVGEWKHQILMPCDFPVSGRCFIESDCLNRHGLLCQMTGGREFFPELSCCLPDERVIKQTALSSAIRMKKRVLESTQ